MWEPLEGSPISAELLKTPSHRMWVQRRSNDAITATKCAAAAITSARRRRSNQSSPFPLQELSVASAGVVVTLPSLTPADLPRRQAFVDGDCHVGVGIRHVAFVDTGIINCFNADLVTQIVPGV